MSIVNVKCECQVTGRQKARIWTLPSGTLLRCFFEMPEEIQENSLGKPPQTRNQVPRDLEATETLHALHSVASSAVWQLASRSQGFARAFGHGLSRRFHCACSIPRPAFNVLCMYMHMCICITCMYIYIYIYIYVYIHVICIYTCIERDLYTHQLYVCIYI